MKSLLLRCTLVLGGLILSVTSSRCFADIMFVFTPSPTGGVNVVGMGSGLVDRPDGIASDDWDVQDFMTNFLQDTFTDAQTSADTAAGTFTNVTTGVSESLLNFDVDRDPDSGDDLDYDTANVLTFSFEDEFLYELTATFEFGTMAFSDLVLGTHIDVGRTQGAGIAEESFGITTVKVVPEPTAVGLLLACVATLAATNWRKRRE